MRIRFRCPTCGTLLGIADRMGGEVVDCPRCSQRILAPAADRPVERGLGANVPPPLPHRSIFPDFPVVLEPPAAGVRVGIPAESPEVKVPKPIAVRLVGVFLLAGGVWSFIHVIGFTLRSGGLCCFWPMMFLELPWGIAASIRGGQMLATRSRPRVPAILVLLQVLSAGCFDLVNFALGFLNILLICAPGTRNYFRNEWGE